MKLSNNKAPVKWYAAKTISGDGFYCMDSGTLAIFDVDNLLKLSLIEEQRVVDRWWDYGHTKMLSMSEKNDCVITTSGGGDGAYPAFWGVDEKDQIVSLYVDFMLFVQETEGGGYASV